MKKLRVAFVLFLLLSASSVMAAGEGEYFTGFRAGLTTGVSAHNDFYNDYMDLIDPYSEYWLGLVMHVENYLMLRTLFTGNYTSLEETDHLTGDEYREPFWRLGGILGVFYQFSLSDRLYCYTGPEMTYIYNYNDNKSSTVEISVSEVRISGILGLQYMLSRNFAIAGDLGLGYTFLDEKRENYGSSPGVTGNKYKSIYLYHAQIGVIFYVN